MRINDAQLHLSKSGYWLFNALRFERRKSIIARCVVKSAIYGALVFSILAICLYLDDPHNMGPLWLLLATLAIEGTLFFVLPSYFVALYLGGKAFRRARLADYLKYPIKIRRPKQTPIRSLQILKD